ncbi:hypothetical protein RQP46_004026 [Phenoliferia psychrophenolica]
MRTSILAIAAVAGLVSAAPMKEPSIADMKRNIIARQSQGLAKRQSTTVGAPDATVLNFALTLEHLEAAFYNQALTKYSAADFDKAGYTGAYPLLQSISNDEAAHVAFLTTALTAAGATPVSACNYTFPYTDIPSFLGLSQVLEGVGTSAYLGAAGSINTTAYLTAAASILTVEARHNAFIRYLNGYSPFPGPEDTPESAAAVVTMATPFFASCPTGSAPAIMGHPALNMTTAAPTVGSMLMVTPANATLAASFTGTVMCGFASGLASGFSEWKDGSCMIPTANVTDGQTYAFLTSGPSIADASVLAGPAILNLGPMIQPVVLSGAAASKTGAGAAGASSTSKPSSANNVAKVSGLALVGAVFAVLM